MFNEKGSNASHVVPTKLWVLILRVLQLFIGFLCLIFAGILVHDIAISQFNFAIVAAVFNLIVLAYIIPSSMLPGVQVIYNVFAVLGLDFLMWVFWLACMGCVAHVRSGNGLKGSSDGFICDGDGFGAECKVISKSHKSIITAEAVFSAFLVILYTATFIYTLLGALRANLLNFGGLRGASNNGTAPAPTEPSVAGTYEMGHSQASPYQEPVPMPEPHQRV